jgi:hypothetical protein
MVTTHRRYRTTVVVLVGLLVLFGATTHVAAARSEVPFHTEMHESCPGCPPPFLCGPTLLCIATAGSGQATHLGQTSEVGQVIVDLASQPGPSPDYHTNTRTVTFTAANGDQLTLALSGISHDTGATSGVTGISNDTWVVTGGTGRFSGATGQGTDTTYIYALEGRSRTVFSGTLSLSH